MGRSPLVFLVGLMLLACSGFGSDLAPEPVKAAPKKVIWSAEAPLPALWGRQPVVLSENQAATGVCAGEGSLPSPGPPPLVAGLFALGPDGPGLQGKKRGNCEQVVARYKGKVLCASGPVGAVMESTWSHPMVSGVFLRFRWNELQPQPGALELNVLREQVRLAVKHNKRFSLAVKAGKAGTPSWIFKRGVKKLSLQDWGSSKTHSCSRPPCCGFTMELGSPTDPVYEELYFEVWRQIAKELAEIPGAMERLAMVKPGGANLISHENRLPKRCESGCVCNTEVWARSGYTPAKLKAYYRRQFSLLSELFPHTDLSYMMIHAGFPRVSDSEHFLSPGGNEEVLPSGVSQTLQIVEMGAKMLGDRFVVQHNGLGPKGSDTPNRYLMKMAKRGQPVGFQTNNSSKVGTTKLLKATLENALSTPAHFVEVYEERLWEATLQGESLLEYSKKFSERRPGEAQQVVLPSGDYRVLTGCDPVRDVWYSVP